jgi:hypothetical protein
MLKASNNILDTRPFKENEDDGEIPYTAFLL